MKCLEKGFGAVRIEAFVSGRETSYEKSTIN